MLTSILDSRDIALKLRNRTNSLREISKASGVPLGTIRHFLRGKKRNHRIDTLKKLTAYFERATA